MKPTIQKKHSQNSIGKVTWVRDWEVATRNEIFVEGSILIRADEYITLISPFIKAKKNMIIASPQTHIQGIYLLDQ